MSTFATVLLFILIAFVGVITWFLSDITSSMHTLVESKKKINPCWDADKWRDGEEVKHECPTKPTPVITEDSKKVDAFFERIDKIKSKSKNKKPSI